MSDLTERGNIVMNSMTSSMQDYLITDPFQYISEQTAEQRSDNVFRKDPDVYLDYLRDWDYVRGLVESYSTPMREILTKNAYKISFKPENLAKYEDFINSKLAAMNIQDLLIESLSEVIYRGGFFKFLIYNKEEKKFRVLDAKDPWKTVYVERLGEPIGYMRSSGKFIDSSQGIFSSYYKYPKKKVTLDQIKNPKIKEKLVKILGGEIEKDMEPDILTYVNYSPRSIFWGQAQKLFQIYLNDIISQFLALKDSIRQELVTVTVQSVTKKTVNTARVTQAIEEALNQGSNLLVQQDPQSLLSQVIFSLFNNVRVLPAVENFSSINNLETQSLKDKRAQLQAENAELKAQVVSNLSIPEELQSGTGNRWEILSRSDKFLTAINSFVIMYEDVVKQFVVSMMTQIGRYCEKSDIVFSLLNDTPLQSQMSRNKSSLFIDSMNDSINAINGVKAMMGTGYVNPESILKEFVGELQRWNLPFSSAYKSPEELLNEMKSDIDSPVNSITGSPYQ